MNHSLLGNARNRDYQEAIARQHLQILAQEQLAQLREDFASTLTHDLKTPLLGAIETLDAFNLRSLGRLPLRNARCCTL